MIAAHIGTVRDVVGASYGPDSRWTINKDHGQLVIIDRGPYAGGRSR